MALETMNEQASMLSWVNSNLVIRKSLLGGSGVFATAPIPQHTTLIVMGGRIIDIKAENLLNAWQVDKPIEISDEFAFCPLTPAEMDLMPQHYVNHSCSPNAGFKSSQFLVAMRDIEPGEEVAYDYAMVLAANPRSRNTFFMACRCGTALCRGVIGEDDWKDSILQERYAPYFQPYILERIRGLQAAQQHAPRGSEGAAN